MSHPTPAAKAASGSPAPLRVTNRGGSMVHVVDEAGTIVRRFDSEREADAFVFSALLAERDALREQVAEVAPILRHLLGDRMESSVPEAEHVIRALDWLAKVRP